MSFHVNLQPHFGTETKSSIHPYFDSLTLYLHVASITPLNIARLPLLVPFQCQHLWDSRTLSADFPWANHSFFMPYFYPCDERSCVEGTGLLANSFHTPLLSSLHTAKHPMLPTYSFLSAHHTPPAKPKRGHILHLSCNNHMLVETNLSQPHRAWKLFESDSTPQQLLFYSASHSPFLPFVTRKTILSSQSYNTQPRIPHSLVSFAPIEIEIGYLSCPIGDPPLLNFTTTIIC